MAFLNILSFIYSSVYQLFKTDNPDWHQV